jgi:hypothetical protein
MPELKKVVNDTAQSNKSSTHLTHHKLGFNSGEHSQILDDLPAWFPKKVTIYGFEIDTRKIVALADFFTTNSFENLLEGNIVTIARPGSSTNEAIFNATFDKTFSEEQREKLKKNLELIDKEENGIRACQTKNLPPSEYYNKQGGTLNKEYTEVSPKDYLIASLVDFDHFLPDALTAWKVGRDSAYEGALAAHKETDGEKKPEMFNLACAKLAFALHYFTDAFSSGHIATPRHELVKKGGLLFGSLLAKEHHDEACRLGFNVENKAKKPWVAYGDGRYFDQVNKKNRSMVNLAIRGILEDLKKVYDTGVMPKNNQEIDMIPQMLVRQTSCNPLFMLKDGKLLRRSEVNNPLCQEYTPHWHTLPTLLERWLHGTVTKIKNCFSLFFCCFLPGDDDESIKSQKFIGSLNKIKAQVPEELWKKDTEKPFSEKDEFKETQNHSNSP